MLIKFQDLITRYQIKPKGVLHIGAHLAEESESYRSMGVNNVIWIEADPDTFNKLSGIVSDIGGNLAYCFAASDTENDSVDFNVASNGESSSLLEMDKHLIHHPHIEIVNHKKVKTRKVDNFLKEKNIIASEYDFLNLDIQGAELLALKGMENSLLEINYVYTEVNTSEIYRGCAKIDELDEYLSKFGFTRKETYMTEYEWGDAFYTKEI